MHALSFQCTPPPGWLPAPQKGPRAETKRNRPCRPTLRKSLVFGAGRRTRCVVICRAVIGELADRRSTRRYRSPTSDGFQRKKRRTVKQRTRGVFVASGTGTEKLRVHWQALPLPPTCQTTWPSSRCGIPSDLRSDTGLPSRHSPEPCPENLSCYPKMVTRNAQKLRQTDSATK